MKMASGYYLNVYGNGRDVFVIFNEPNSEPSAEELTALAALVEREIEKPHTDAKLREIIEDTGLKCVEYGVQVILVSQ